MDLKSGYPYWAVKNGLMHAFPKLPGDLRCDVAIVGGGISGALIANELVDHGFDVVVVEQRDIGWGSTAASTAMLQYEIDTPMHDLAKMYGETDAALAYLSCAQAVTDLGDLCRDVGAVDFRRTRSVYYASHRRHVQAMRDELTLRSRHGLDVRWLGADELQADYGIHAPGAILSEVGARLDPYRLTYRLFARLEKRGTRVYDRTRIESIRTTSRSVTLDTADGARIRAGHAVMATGYAGQRWLQQTVARNRSSYAFVTDPLEGRRRSAPGDVLVWESSRPYLYFRATGDGRLVVGGEDDAVDIPARRDARVDRKAQRLVRKVARALPDLRLQPAFAWAGTFAETADGLPFFGPHPEYGSRLHFAMAYGGNGITYSLLGAGLLRALIERRRHPLQHLFGFSRLDRRPRR